ncbi:MAG: hypothetical protein LC118_20285 [Dehalococcoidia bacterium]|nr:hypothetical protein [Dehalococcoidia bacterium]
MNRARFRTLASFLLGAAATYIGAEVSRAFWAWNDSPRSVGSYVASTIVSWLLIGLGGTVTALLVHRGAIAMPALFVAEPKPTGWSAAWPFTRSVAALLLAVSWIATAVFGAPAAITANTAQDIESYKWFAQRQALPLSAPFPRINTTVAAPILPGVILLWHGVQLAGQAGGGGWELWVWYGATPRRVHYWTRWWS